MEESLSIFCDRIQNLKIKNVKNILASLIPLTTLHKWIRQDCFLDGYQGWFGLI